MRGYKTIPKKYHYGRKYNGHCESCFKELPNDKVYQYIDGNNYAITYNSKYLCESCYIKEYPQEEYKFKKYKEVKMNKNIKELLNEKDFKNFYYYNIREEIPRIWYQELEEIKDNIKRIYKIHQPGFLGAWYYVVDNKDNNYVVKHNINDVNTSFMMTSFLLENNLKTIEINEYNLFKMNNSMKKNFDNELVYELSKNKKFINVHLKDEYYAYVNYNSNSKLDGELVKLWEDKSESHLEGLSLNQFNPKSFTIKELKEYSLKQLDDYINNLEEEKDNAI